MPLARTTRPAVRFPRKLILRNFLCPGDLVMLTAAVRDLHRCCPRQFITDVRTSCPDLWLHNPHLTPLDEAERGVEIINCSYPLIHCSNEAPFHMLHGFHWFLNQRLGVRIVPTEFRGEVLLSHEEKAAPSQVAQIAGREIPFWLIVSGGKFDYTAKWWDASRFQEVVDRFRGRIQFVQVGEIGHHHPKLRGAIDLRGRTTLRELVRLVYRAQGVVCGVTALMHLAAAVELPPGLKSRPGVIIAGGREATHWEAYPHHQFIHTIGALPCCANGGCWRSRARALGDGALQDNSLCVDIVGALPRCMHMISEDEVIARIQRYFDGGALRYLTRVEADAGRQAVRASGTTPNFDSTLNLLTAPAALRERARHHSPVPPRHGRGVLLFAKPGAALPLAKRVRQKWPELPIELRAESLTRNISHSLQKLRVVVKPRGAANPILHALMEIPWREVVVLSRVSDFNHPIEFMATTFFPDRRQRVHVALWKLSAMQPPDRAVRGTIACIDMEECHRAVGLAHWMAEQHHYLFLRELGGELGTLHFAREFIAARECVVRNSSSARTGAQQVARVF